MEGAAARNAACRAHLAPCVGDQIESLQVVKAAVRLVHTSKDEHVVAKDHGSVAVSVGRAVAAGLHLPPLVRDEAVLVQVVERVASVPSAEHDQAVRVSVHDAAVAEASGGHSACGLQAAPAPRLDVVAAQVVEPAGAVVAAEDINTGRVQHHDVVRAGLGSILQHAGHLAPALLVEVEVVQVVEVVPVPAVVAAEDEHVAVVHNAERARASGRQRAARLHLRPGTGVQVELVQVLLSASAVRAAEHVHATI
ncbi:unnamed protein product [Phytophthora lilii]|uniref:Unnamed protein product n=1 Tax=Phytophthora lilii TaxID=2077276 RepID=A0A9W6U547_9STRA|nr:unnamed protein product [Phytophthora lilii]